MRSNLSSYHVVQIGVALTVRHNRVNANSACLCSVEHRWVLLGHDEIGRHQGQNLHVETASGRK